MEVAEQVFLSDLLETKAEFPLATAKTMA